MRREKRVSDEEWCIRIPKPKKLVDSLKKKLSENHSVNKSRRVVREIAETFKGRTKLAITTAVAYMLWMSFYKVMKEGVDVFLPRYSGFLQSVIELAIISSIAVMTLYLLSKWE